MQVLLSLLIFDFATVHAGDDVSLMAICGTDERTLVVDTEVQPYNYICVLDVYSPNNTRFQETAFKVLVPGTRAGRQLLFTAAHNVYFEPGAYGGPGMGSVYMQCPGQRDWDTLTEIHMHVPDDYIKNPVLCGVDDYGVIVLDGENVGFSYNESATDSFLLTQEVTVVGYPMYKPPQQMWSSAAGPITDVSDDQLFYYIDTMSGDSGGPVYRHAGGNWVAYAIQSGIKGNCSSPNTATRIDETVMGYIRGFM